MLSLATVASVSYIAQQFAQTNQNIANIPNQIQPSPCSWPNDRTQIINTTEQTRSNTETANTTLGVITNTQLVGINSTVNTINSGVTGLVNTIGTATSTATNTLFGYLQGLGRSLYLDKIYNALTFLMSLHNAMMLTQNLGQSLGFLIDSFMQLVSPKDENNEPLDINQIIGNSVANFVKGIVGEERFNGLSLNWKRLNVIWNATASIYNLMLNSMTAMAESLNIIGTYTGKIGNALKRSGTVLENSYQWMQDVFKFNTGKFAKINSYVEGVMNATEISDELTEAIENANEFNESWQQIGTEMTRIRETVNEFETTKNDSETTAKNESKSPPITNDDFKEPNN